MFGFIIVITLSYIVLRTAYYICTKIEDSQFPSDFVKPMEVPPSFEVKKTESIPADGGYTINWMEKIILDSYNIKGLSEKERNAYVIEEIRNNMTLSVSYSSAPPFDYIPEKRKRTPAPPRKIVPLPPHLNQEYEICYADAKGNETVREIRIHDLVLDKKYHVIAIKGYCHMRRVAREFKTNRISQIIDLSTGEVIASASQFLTGITMGAE